MNLVVYGTRPETVKLYPFTKYPDFKFLEVRQSKDLLNQELINPDWQVTEDGLEDFIKRGLVDMLPHWDKVIVQGDTRTAFRAALYAFEAKIPVIHVEAGMRTYDLTSPFPEEGYRQMIDRIATWKFCSTPEAIENLIDDNCADEKTLLVGQTSIDSLSELYPKEVPQKDFYIVTVHRNESWNRLPEIIDFLSKRTEPLHIYAHPNRIGQELRKHFACLNPLPYHDWVVEMAQCKGFISDSGGLQEEAIFLGKEFISLREKSERGKGESYSVGATQKIVDILGKL